MRLNIVIAAGLLLDEHPSGAGRRLLETLAAAARLLRPNEAITVLHRTAFRPPATAESNVSWHAVDAKPGTTLRRVLQERRLLPRLLRELGADVVEIGSLPVPPNLPCPVALTVHDLRDFHGLRRSHVPRWLLRRTLRISLRRANAVAVPSEATATDLRSFGGAHMRPVHIVPGGVRVPAQLPDPEPSSRPYFLHVGHLEPRKNLEMLLDAFADLLEKRSIGPQRPRLLFVGRDGGSRDQLQRRIAASNLADSVQILQDVDDARLDRLLRGTRALLVPSLLEGFGQPVLEGLAMGAAVVVSDRGSLPEVIGNAGEVLPACNPESWTRAMERHCVSDAGADAAAVHRRLTRAREFPWSATAAAQLEVWRAAAAAVEVRRTR